MPTRRRSSGDPEDHTRSHEKPPADPTGLFSAWTPRSILVPYILLSVSIERAHGYLIEESLRGLGFFGIGMSTLYRTLRQMEKDGLLESAWESGEAGPARRVYWLTEGGRARLDASAIAFDAYRETIDRFFGLYARPAPTRRTRTKR